MFASKLDRRGPFTVLLVLAMAVSLLTVPTATSAQEAFDPDDFDEIVTFDGYEHGPLSGQDGWEASAAVAVTEDPEGTDNRVMRIPDPNLWARRAMPAIPEGGTGTIFFRMYRDGLVDASLGLSASSAPQGFGDFEVQANIQNTPTLNARDGGGFASAGTWGQGTWQCVWMVADNEADTYEMYSLGGPYEETTRLPVDAETDFAFRNGTTDPLGQFFATTGGSSPANVYVDDVAVDAEGRNLSIPVADPENACGYVEIPDPPGPLECAKDGDQEYALEGEKEAVLETHEVGTTWAGHYVDQALLTDDDDQYVAYYDADRRMTVAHRTLDDDEWTRAPLDEVTGWDSHNYITMAVDRDGHLHVSGNMHNHPLVYFRTETAGDVTSLTRVDTMVDPGMESRVTYPNFLHLEDGTLLFRYREGGSGDGIDIYNQYDEDTRGWSALLETPLLDGEGQRNAYSAKPVLGPDGYYHMVWVWRDTPNAASTHTVSYARSADLVNWETSAGEPLALPVTYDTSDVVDPVPPWGGVINNNVQVGFDGSGDPVVAYHKYDGDGNTQVYLARPDDSESGWENVQVTDWTGAWEFAQGGTLVFQVEIYWAPELLPDGNIRLDLTCTGEERTVVADGETLEPIAEIDTPSGEPAEVRQVRSDYEHDVEGESGTEMQVNLNDDSGDAGPYHARQLRREDGIRHLLRWESLGENQDRPRAAWPEPQPIEVVVLATKDACKDGGWRNFSDPTFRNQGECVSWIQGDRP